MCDLGIMYVRYDVRESVCMCRFSLLLFYFVLFGLFALAFFFFCCFLFIVTRGRKRGM